MHATHALLGIVAPPPLWAISAEHSAARMAALAAERAVPAELPIVTRHPKPWRQVGIEALPSAARAFMLAAERAGLTTAARMAGDTAAQVGIRAREREVLWMRATWHLTPAGAWQTDGVIVDGHKLGVTAAKAAW